MDSPPAYIYKLVPPSESPFPALADLPEKLPVSALDEKSGFIHMSTAKQVPNTLKRFYKDHLKVYVLRVVYDQIESVTKWEDPQAENCGPRGGGCLLPVLSTVRRSEYCVIEGMFPHIYNDLKLGKSEIEQINVLQRDTDSEWDGALQEAKEEWLKY